MKKQTEPINIFNHFFKSEAAAGVVLLLFAISAIVIANVPQFSHIHNIWQKNVLFSFGDFKIEMDLVHWINDGLMAIFFFLVGMEIKREVMAGELSSLKHASLPIFGAIGGMLLPALIFISFTKGTPAQNGWGIPMATDIAFSIGILTLLGKRVPLPLKIFLTALAIVDDLGAIIVLAIFYPAHAIDPMLLIAAALVIVLLFALNRYNVTNPMAYLFLGVILWIIILFSGVHATLAGVIAAMFIPFKYKDRSPMNEIEHMIHPYVTFIILPIFALSNAGVQIDTSFFKGGIDPLAWGIFLGLTVGKPLGIFGLSWIAHKAGIAELPSGVKWSQIFAVGLIAGIGFTMSIFIDNLAFSDENLIETGKVSIIFASFTAAVLGMVMLYATTGKKTIEQTIKSK